MRILIVYGTTEGQTRKIARFMEDVLQREGHAVAITDANDDPPAATDYDAVIIGASMHIQKYQAGVTHYIISNLSALNKMPTAFFSVCLAIASDLEDEHLAAKKVMDDYLHSLLWKPTATTQIAGALKYTQYDFFKRLVMKMISKQEGRTTDTAHDYEYTDWQAVKQFVLDFAEHNQPLK